ncbi:MAG: amino acid adenylation domain-containing protein [Myxococcales bacterium FL481]|nr:MAG: amino acid adenylation domain-containing protein [Myxococcales bacterium FL481]
MTFALHEPFFHRAALQPDAAALEVDGTTLSYGILRQDAQRIAATLVDHRETESCRAAPLTAVLGHRSRSAFAGILGTLASGHGYVPMLPTTPVARLHRLIERSEVQAMVVDHHAHEVLPALLETVSKPLTVVSPDQPFAASVTSAFAQHRLVGPAQLSPASKWTAPTRRDDAIAYLLFTSGSTGEPKGVMVSHRNVAHFLDVVTRRYQLDARDRFSHLFEPTFDLSVFDMFAAWGVGACVCCPNAAQRLLPNRYITDARLTVWFSVPSVAVLLGRMRALAPNAFPQLRLSLFCGEALTEETARSWSQAAINSVLENLYGPTEVTLACTAYRWQPDSGTQDGVVPIGAAFPGLRERIVAPDLTEVPHGEPGELLMSGPQVALGYWRDPERTDNAFVTPPGEATTFYRTGDRVRRQGPEQALHFLGRLDHQIKIHGHRVELGEIEAVMRREAQLDTAVAVGWPRTASGAAGVVAFVRNPTMAVPDLQRRLAALLPAYMVPKRILVIDDFPLNTNGKVDRNALLAHLA